MPKSSPKGREVGLKIKGVVLEETVLYSVGPYTVRVGYIETDSNKDIPHYLLVNSLTGVVEGSSARLFEARGMCQAYAKELEEQDNLIANEIDIVERVDDPDGNVDPDFKPKGKEWKSH